MNKEQFYNYLSNPEMLSNISENDIDDITTEFPYFQTAYILKAKILSDKKSIKFDNQIKTASLYALDRRLLYEFINTKYSAKEIKEEISKEEIVAEVRTEEKIAPIETAKEEPIEKIVEAEVEITEPTELKQEKDTEKELELVKDKIPEDKEEAIEEKIETPKAEIIETEIPKQEEYAKEIEIPEQEPEIVKEVKQEILEPKQEQQTKPVVKTRFTGKRTIADEVLDKLRAKIENKEAESIADKILREAKERKEKKKLLTVSEKKEEVIIKPKQEVVEEKVEEEVAKEEIEQKLIEPKQKRKLYFVKINSKNPKVKLPVEALQEIKDEQIITEPISIETELDDLIPLATSSYNIEEEVETISPSSKMEFSDWLNYVETRSEKPKEITKNSLIDKFISENPSISINIDDGANSENEEKPLKKDKGDKFVTETLANIYIKQKHFEKAISAMEKLSLKYPQKNGYFANRIKEIKKLIKE